MKNYAGQQEMLLPLGFCQAFLTAKRNALQASTRDTNNQATTTTRAIDLLATATTTTTTRATGLQTTTTTTTTDHQAATTTIRVTGHHRTTTATTKGTDHHRPATQPSQATATKVAAAATGRQAATIIVHQVAMDTRAASINLQFLLSPIQAEGVSARPLLTRQLQQPSPRGSDRPDHWSLLQ